MSIQLNIGDEIFTGNVRGRGGHGATVIVEKINRKSIIGTERERSYTPGTKWTIRAGCEIAKVTYDGERIDKDLGLLVGLRRDLWGTLGEHGFLER